MWNPPDIEGDRHNGVEYDGVGEENEQRDDDGAGELVSRDDEGPGQVHLEPLASRRLPEQTGDGAERTDHH